jgi:formate dehydrogenase subunit gamma
MRWYKPWPLSWRTGATFVHDWIFLGLCVTITGHVMFALRDPDSLRSMWEGTISRVWARRNAPRWLEESAASDEGQADIFGR